MLNINWKKSYSKFANDNLEQYINNTQGKLNFILSAETLKFGDKRRIKDVIFMPSNFTTVLVHDSQNLIGA
jgi:hypothetical protein